MQEQRKKKKKLGRSVEGDDLPDIREYFVQLWIFYAVYTSWTYNIVLMDMQQTFTQLSALHGIQTVAVSEQPGYPGR